MERALRMAKQRNVFVCSECGVSSSKWVGQCTGCRSWNTMEEGAVAGFHATRGSSPASSALAAPVRMLSEVSEVPQVRMVAGIPEWDRVLGGGLLPGSFIILTGDPGIGKSTLMLQVAHRLAEQYSTLYFSSEESLEQVRGRAARLGCLNTPLLFSDHAQLDAIIAAAESHRPKIMIIDSIQNCYSPSSDTTPGSPSQLREAAFRLLRLAKERQIAILLSGHITKDGVMAGPKTLEHMVDAVFYLQGDDRLQTRILRAVKNRFGPIDEIGFFEMQESGLQECPNINAQILAEVSHAPGASLVSSLEGSRPLLVELQALVIKSHFTMPQRIVTGIDQKQVVLIAAILEKYLKIGFSSHDIFFKVSGGARLKGSSADLGIALALLSSYFQHQLPQNSISFGEVSLTGQIKPIQSIAQHVNEAHKFGISTMYLSKQQKIEQGHDTVRRFGSVYDLLSLFPLDEQ